MKFVAGCSALALVLGAAAPFLNAQNTEPMGQGAQESGYTTTTTHGERTPGGDMLDPIDAEDFVDTASAKGIAEIETAKLAREKGSERVRGFADQMIKDHRAANERLTEIAKQENVEVSDEATLMDKAKAMILRVRDGESFDEAYINNQINAHEETIELFRRAAANNHGALSEFAKESLPTLEKHLQMARDLQSPRADR